MQLTDKQWNIFWWIRDNYPNYKSESPEQHSLIINMMDNYTESQKSSIISNIKESYQPCGVTDPYDCRSTEICDRCKNR